MYPGKTLHDKSSAPLAGGGIFYKKKFYYAIHAPRQTGKTTYLHALAKKLNKEGNHIALVVFDPADKTWDEKIFTEEIGYDNKAITLIGL